MTLHAVSPDTPRIRRECPTGPCPHVACRFHLWTERRFDQDGAVVALRETPAFGDADHTCTLHETARGPKTLEEIGAILDVSRERVRQIEGEALTRLRDADPGVLRELLDAINETTSDGEPWTEDSTLDDGACPEFTTDTTAEDGDQGETVTDATDVPEGADAPVRDESGALPWSEPTSTDTRSLTVNKQRIERANARACEARPFWCPYCGRTYPGVTIESTTRRACPNPRCQGRAWGDRARAQGKRGTALAPAVAAAILAEYQPGVRGYKTLAREHGVSRAAIQRLIQGHANREEG